MVSTAARVGSINVLLAVQFGQATQGLNTFAGAVEKTGARTQRAVSNIDRSVLGMNKRLSEINSGGFTSITVGALQARNALDQMRGLALAAGVAIGGLVPAAAVVGMVRTTDAAHRLSNQLRTVTDGSADLTRTQDALFQVAQRSRAAFDSTVTIYARTARATEHLGLSQQKLLRITETVQKAFAVGGASAQEAQGAAIQLSQGIASNRLGGEEFRSVAENAPVLLRGMADSLGVTIGKLREMAHAGELTADVVTKTILDASDAIEADFAKTSSTIEQAWVKIGNAAIKYAMDSKSASAASSAIVSVLNGVSSNIDTVADSLLLLGGTMLSIMGGRPLNALRQNTAAMGAHLAMVRQTTAAAVQQAQAEAAANATRLASARAYYAQVTQGVATEATRVKASRELHAANIANLASQKALTVATAQHAAALSAASASGRIFAATGRAASAAWSFIGGPFGLALMAIGTAMYVISSEAAKSQAELQRFAEAADNVQSQIAAIEGRAKTAKDGLAQLAEGFRDLIKVEGFARAQAEVNTLKDSVGDMGRQLQELARQVSVGSGSAALGVQITTLTSQFRTGAIGAEEYAAKLNEIARANPDQSKVIADMADLSEEIERVNPQLAEMERQVDALDGKNATVTIQVVKKGDFPIQALSDGRFENRFDSVNSSALAAGDWETIFPSLFKEPKKKGRGESRKSADDQFANSIQSIYDRIAAMQQEQAALNLSFREQERRKIALDLEQQALRQVREEARRKGEQDWQNAQLAPEQVAQINAAANAYANQALALKRASEEQEALKDAAGEFGGIIKGMIDGTMQWEDALLQAGLALLKLLNDMNVAKGGSGIFGGGWFQSLIGGILGVAFHGGGTVGTGGNVVQFPTGVPFVGEAHTGRTIGGGSNDHREVLALLQEEETVFTKDQTGQIIDRLSSATSGMSERSTYAPVYNIDARGADAAAVARIERGLKERDRQFGNRVVGTMKTTQSRKTRPA